MRNTLTANQKTEEHINAIYSNCYSAEKAYDVLKYLTVKGRTGGHTTKKTIFNYYANHMLGVLIRKYDRMAFECIKSNLNHE